MRPAAVAMSKLDFVLGVLAGVLLHAAYRLLCQPAGPTCPGPPAAMELPSWWHDDEEGVDHDEPSRSDYARFCD